MNECVRNLGWMILRDMAVITRRKSVQALISPPQVPRRLTYDLTRRGQLKCDGTRAENRFRLSAKRTSTFKSAGASVQLTTGSRGVRISGSNVVYTVFRGSAKDTGYPLHLPVSPSLPIPCVTVCDHISTGVYLIVGRPATKQPGPWRGLEYISWDVIKCWRVKYRCFGGDYWLLFQG